MSPRRFQQVDRLLAAALEREPGLRAPFLDEACDGDDALRREVVTLLEARERGDAVPTRVSSGTRGGVLETEPEGPTRPPTAGTGFGAPELPAGMLLDDRFEIEALVGRGGMGAVYLARDCRLGRRVAIKLLPAEVASDEERVARFRWEACVTGALSHRSIVTVYDLAAADGVNYIVTEFVEGRTLRQLLDDGPIGVRDAVAVAAEVASALAAAHEAGVVHRDVKPENVMLGPRGSIKVLDFGIAKLVEDRRGLLSDTTSGPYETREGTLVGTVSYMSPEQAMGEAVDRRTDVWSLGVMLYEMVAGARPFTAPSSRQVLASVLAGEPEPLRRRNPDAPEELERIVRLALAKSRDDRYPGAREMQQDLEELVRALDGTVAEVRRARAIRPPRDEAPSRRRRWAERPALAGVALCAALLGLAGAASLGDITDRVGPGRTPDAPVEGATDAAGAPPAPANGPEEDVRITTRYDARERTLRLELPMTIPNNSYRRDQFTCPPASLRAVGEGTGHSMSLDVAVCDRSGAPLAPLGIAGNDRASVRVRLEVRLAESDIAALKSAGTWRIRVKFRGEHTTVFNSIYFDLADGVFDYIDDGEDFYIAVKGNSQGYFDSKTADSLWKER